VTRDEYLALPPSLALAVLLDAAPGLVAKLEAIPVPKVPRPPKYDFAIFRKDGIQWASETATDGLLFWRARYQKSADGGGEYATKDAKRVKTLDMWIAWRRIEPATPWAGERDNAAVTASPPSDRPRVYPRKSQSQSSDGGSAAEPSGGEDGEIANGTW
jgi:hypothetical protein